MTEMIQLSNTAAMLPVESEVQQTLEVGDVIEGEVTSKSDGLTSVLIDERLVKLASDVEIVEEVGEKLRLEVVKVSKDVIELKYMKPVRLVEEDKSVRYEPKKSFELPKAYNKDLIKAVKTMDPQEAKVIEDLVQKVEKNLTVLMDTMTDTDIQTMLKDDLNPQKISIDMMTEIVKSNKESFRVYDIKAIELEASEAIETIKARYTVDERLEDIVLALKSKDLPVSKKNIDRLIEATDKVDQVVNKLEDKWVNVLKIEGQATLEKLYKATSIPVPMDKPVQMSDFEMENMVKQHIQSLELDASEDAIDVAVKMIKQDIPITKPAVEFAMMPAKVIKGLPEIELIERMAAKIVESKPVESVEVPVIEREQVQASVQKREVVHAEVKVQEREVSSAEVSTLKSEVLEPIDLKAKQLMIKLQDISYNQVVRATYKHEELNLEQIMIETDEPLLVKEEQVIPEHLLEDSKSMVTRHRQVEEIRLKMTYEAAVKLESTGLNIETEPLEKVVDALKSYETELIINQSKAHQIHEAIRQPIAEEVVKVLEGYKQLKQIPEIAPVETLQIQEATKELPTVEVLIQKVEETKEAGFVRSIPKEVVETVVAKKANVAYEQSETQVRRDLGDKVEKTFKQIEPMLIEMEIEPTKEAIKAVEILARNEMPITEENILELQLVQEKVDYITTRMNPRLVLEMVKVGITPLDLNLDETIEIIEQYDQKFGETEAEKIGRLIHTLESDGLINEEQRESLMGIYRTFDTVVRSKGAATGFVVKNDMPLNIEQLFEAAKFIKKTGQIKSIVEVDVDDSFGRLTKIERADKSIKEQVMTAIDQLAMPQSKATEQAVEVLEEQEVTLTKTKVLSKMLMDMTLRSFVHSMNHESMVQVSSESAVTEPSAATIWQPTTDSTAMSESIKTIPLKELEVLVRGVLENKQAETISEAANTATSRKQIEAITKFIKNNPEVVKQMIKNEIPMSPENIEKAIEINKEPFALLTKLRQIIDSVDNETLRTEVVDKIANTSRQILSGEKSIDSLKEALQEIEVEIHKQSDLVSNNMTQNLSDAGKTVTHTQMIQLTEDYYQIPIMMGNELSQLNMYILNSGEDSIGNEYADMKVVMRFDTKNLGPVTAYLELSGNQMSLNMHSNNDSDQGLLGEFETQIRALVDETNFTLSGIGYKDLEIKTPVESTTNSDDNNQIVRTQEGNFEAVI